MNTDALTVLPLLAVGVLLIILARLRSPRITPAVRRAVRATIAASAASTGLNPFAGVHHQRIYPALTRSRDGLAVALLLLNAAAKTNPALYEHKVVLLRAVVDASQRGAWWMSPHDHPLATTYTDTSVVYVETTIGPILDLERVQISAHVSAPDAIQHFADAPTADGRGWAGIALQPRAAEIAREFLARNSRRS